MSTHAETLVIEERLRPEPVSFIPPNVVTKRSVPYSLMRSSSLDRIRQFPAYFCLYGSTEIIQWLSSSSSKLSKAVADFSKQLHLVLLTASVYAAIGLLTAQLMTCIIAVIFGQLPLGLIFLVSCVAVMAGLATRLMAYPNVLPEKHRSRPTTRRLKKD